MAIGSVTIVSPSNLAIRTAISTWWPKTSTLGRSSGVVASSRASSPISKTPPTERIAARSSKPSTSSQTTGHFSRAIVSSWGESTVDSCVLVPSQAVRRRMVGWPDDEPSPVLGAVRP